VLGEPSIAVRNRDATMLLETGFLVLNDRVAGRRTTVAENLPLMRHPAFPGGPLVEQGSEDESDRTKPVSVSKHHRSAHQTPARKRH